MKRKIKKWKYEGVKCKCGSQAVVKGYCRHCYDKTPERERIHKIKSRERYLRIKGGDFMEYKVSKMKELVSAVETEIELTRNKLAELEQVLETVRKYDEEGRSEGTRKIYGEENIMPVRRRLKNTRFSDIEVTQMINMWNKLSQLPNLSQGDVISKIANTLKQPRKRIHNKIWWLARTGRIKNKYALPQPVTDTKVRGIHATRNGYKRKMFNWTPEATKNLIGLSNANKSPSEISRITGIDAKVISNKLNRLRGKKILPRIRYIENPLANL